MAITWWNAATFAEVEHKYNTTQPIRGKMREHNGSGICPIGDRRRKHERIVKITDSCYILSDGNAWGDPTFPHWLCAYSGLNSYSSEDEFLYLAPIVWRKHRNGSESVKIRNGSGRGMHNARYSFLDRYLPRGLQFRIRSGKQFVMDSTNTDYYLAKGTTVNAAYFEYLNNTENAMNRFHNDLTDKKDNVAITVVRQPHGTWEFDGGGKPAPKPPRIVVDKRAKDKMKPSIDTFREWCFTMYNLWDFDNHEEVSNVKARVKDHYQDNPKVQVRWGSAYNALRQDTDEVRKIIRDEDHPMRSCLGFMFMDHCTEGEYVYQNNAHQRNRVTDIKEVKTKFNREINKMCGFQTKKKG